MDWKIEVENLNVILTTSAPSLALTRDALKIQLQSNLHPDLRRKISLEPVLATELSAWALKVKECNDQMRAEYARTQKLIDSSAIAHATCRTEKKYLLSRLTDPPTTSSSSGSKKTKTTDTAHLPALTEAERTLIRNYAGCTLETHLTTAR
jgi:hypothetical protein